MKTTMLQGKCKRLQGLVVVLILLLVVLISGIITKESYAMATKDEKPTYLDKLRALFAEEEGGDLYLTAGDVTTYGGQVPDDLLKWWELNKEWLLPWTVPKEYVGRATGYTIQMEIEVTEHFNNTGRTFAWSYDAEGLYSLVPTPALPDGFIMFVYPITNSQKQAFVSSVSTTLVAVEGRNSSGDLDDISFFFEIRLYD